MEFQVLGPLGVIGGTGLEVQVGNAPKVRLLLSILLAHHGTTLSIDTLVGALWTDEPPASARRNIHQYIHRLRATLGSSQIKGSPGGYALVTPAESVDMEVFARRSAEGEAALADGNPHLAAKLLQEALDLWRGEPFAGFEDCPLIIPVARRLHRELLVAQERWVRAQLACDRPLQVLPLVEGVAREHRHTESVVGLWMQALACSGRTAEALAVFRETRQSLREELGIEPGAELSRVHQAILRGEDPRPSPFRLPRQLPPDITGFVGRQREFEQLIGADTAVVAIHGPPGSGKSALAVHVAHALADRFPDGQLYLDLQGATPGLSPLDPLEGLGRWLRALGINSRLVPGNLAEATALLRQLVSRRRLLMVLDNALEVRQVRPFLVGGHDSRMLITSREQLSTLDNTTAVGVGRLSADEAVALLARFDRRASAPGAAASIVDFCERLPLALRIVGARLAQRPNTTLAEVESRLRDERQRLDELQQQDLSVRASIAVSHRQLDAQAAALLSLAGLLSSPELNASVAAALLDTTVPQAVECMDRLADAQLVVPRHGGRYALPDLVRLYARETASPDPAALQRVLDHYHALAWQALKLLVPHAQRMPAQPDHVASVSLSTPDEALVWLDQELPTVLAVLRQAPNRTAAAIGECLGLPLLAVVCRWTELQEVGELLVAIGEQQRDTRITALGWENTALAQCVLRQGEIAVDSARRAVALCDDKTDVRDAYGAVLTLGYALAGAGRPAEYADQLREAATLCRDRGYRAGEASALDHLGRLARLGSRCDEAMALHRESLSIFRTVTSPMSMATCLQNLAWAILASDGDAAVASGHFAESLTIWPAVTYPLNRAAGLWGWATAQHRLGATRAAFDAWQEALDLLRQVGAHEGDAAVPGELPAVPAILRALV